MLQMNETGTLTYANLEDRANYIMRRNGGEPIQVFCLEDDQGAKSIFTYHGCKLLAEVYADNTVEWK